MHLESAVKDLLTRNLPPPVAVTNLGIVDQPAVRQQELVLLLTVSLTPPTSR